MQKIIGEFFNIVTGEDLTIKELPEIIKQIVRFKDTIVGDFSIHFGIPYKVINLNKLNKLVRKPETLLKLL